MKRTLFLMLLAVLSVSAFAQKHNISGQLLDHDSQEPMMQATVQLLTTDSTYVAGAVSDADGKFRVQSAAGHYLLKVSSVGYKTLYKNIELTNKNLALGKLEMYTDAVLLKGAEVVVNVPKVTVKEDTFIYNAAAYRTPEGSVVEELVKRLPGAQVDDDGSITINGKKVSKIKMDGKEFMTGDTQTALKNLPTSIIERVKAYDERSDLSRITGIDDGNEETVIDFGIKKGMNKGLISNIDLAVGTKDRFAERLMGGYFNSKFRLMMFGNANNTNDSGFPGGGGGGGGRWGGNNNGQNTAKMLGLNFNYEDTKLVWNGSLRWNHRNGDSRSISSSESFVSTTGAFTNSNTTNLTRSNQWNANMRLEWKPDTMTNILFRPNWSYSTNDGRNSSNSGSYNQDPYLTVGDPLAEDALKTLAEKGFVVNSRSNSSISYSDNKRVGSMLQFNRKLNSKGRNVTLRFDGSYGEGESNNFSISNVHLYQVIDLLGNDSTYQTNRYRFTPTKNYNYTAQVTYSEPLWKAAFLQLSYKYNYSYSKSDQATYSFDNLGEAFFAGIKPLYRQWDNYLDRLEKPYTDYFDQKQSRFSEYKTYTQDIELMFRKIHKDYNFNMGVMVQPLTSHFKQDYQGVKADTTRHVTNITPTVDFRYKFNKTSNLRLNYRGSTSQPSMTQLLDITDDSDPLNISKGNPGLKPAFTNNLRANFNTTFGKRITSIFSFLNFQTTRNSISNMVTYDEKTGGRTSRPENINGNWSANGMFMINTSLDTLSVWNVNSATHISYNNNVGYVTLGKTAPQKNTTKNTTLSERLGASFRNDWLEVEIDGSVNYNHARNELQSQSNMDTWQFGYGMTVGINTPWGMGINTNAHMNSRRGYNDASMNTNEFVWNAQVSQSFLKGKPLTVMIQFYDLLHNQTSFSRTISAMQRSDTQYNNINSYVMLHVSYRFNLFGGKDMMKGGPGGPGGRGPGGMRPPMGGMGGFGGRGRF